MKKIIIGILIVALVIGTFVAVGVNLKKQAAENEELAQLSERHLYLNSKRTGLVAQKNELISLRASETRLGNYLVLFFDSVDTNLIESVYPLLEKNGMKGTIVLCDGRIPGEEGNISREDFDFLLSEGWDYAIGYSNEVDLSADNAAELLASYLDDYMTRLEEADIAVPFTYCFARGEYHKKFAPVLKERGFKVVRHYGETGENFGGEYLEGELYYIGCGVYSATSTKIQESVDTAYAEDLAFSVSVRHIADSAIDTRKDCTTSRYQKMLSYLINTCTGTVVCTVGELYGYKQEQHASVSGTIGGYNASIAEIDNQIAEIDKELADIILQLE